MMKNEKKCDIIYGVVYLKEIFLEYNRKGIKMENITSYTGKQIKMYRKIRGLTLQNLADRIKKSRGTLCKYENGDIILDIETLE